MGRSDIPDELLVLEDRVTWNTFQEVTKELKCSIRKVEKAHIIRLKTYCGLQEQGEFMTSLCREMGWVKMKLEEEEVRAEKCNVLSAGRTSTQMPHWLHMNKKSIIAELPCVGGHGWSLQGLSQILSYTCQVAHTFTLRQRKMLAVPFTHFCTNDNGADSIVG